MPLYYVTGTPGAGKSAVQAELSHRGYEAHEADDLAAFYEIRTGTKLTVNVASKDRTPAWRRYHEWRIPPDVIHALSTKAAHKTIFLCGVVANDADFWDKFDETFCLFVPPTQLEARLRARPGDVYGKAGHELANALEWAGYAKQQYMDLGAIIIDATQPVEAVVDNILSIVRKLHP